MRCLIISPVPTDPVNAGNRARIANLVEGLKACRIDVHFALLPMEAHDHAMMQKRFGADRFHALEFHPRREPFLAAFLRKVGRRFKVAASFQWGIDAWFDDGILPQLEALHASWKFDVVLVEYVFISKAFCAFPGEVLKVLDTHDRFGLRHERYLASGKEPQWFSTSLDEEIVGFNRADVVLAIQGSEANDFRARIGEKGEEKVVQVGHLLGSAEPVKIPCSRSAVFLGSDNPINTAGLMWFIRNVLPIVRGEFQEFTLKVAGSVCNTIPVTQGVELLGYVDQLVEIFSSAAVNVNPVQMGTGINIKLLDALAYGMPSVTSRSGARGLENLEGRALRIVDDLDATGFAEHICALLRNRNEIEECAKAAYQAARDWNAMQFSNLNAVFDMAGKR